MQLLVSFFLNVRFQGTGRDMANLKCGSTMEEPSNSDRQCCRLESWVSDINRRPISPLFSLFQLLIVLFRHFIFSIKELSCKTSAIFTSYWRLLPGSTTSLFTTTGTDVWVRTNPNVSRCSTR